MIHNFASKSLIGPIGMYYVVYPTIVDGTVEFATPVPSIGVFAGKFVVMFLLLDFMFYWSHRLMHYGILYKLFHKRHHEFHEPIGISCKAFYVTGNTLLSAFQISVCDFCIVAFRFVCACGRGFVCEHATVNVGAGAGEDARRALDGAPGVANLGNDRCALWLQLSVVAVEICIWRQRDARLSSFAQRWKFRHLENVGSFVWHRFALPRMARKEEWREVGEKGQVKYSNPRVCKH